LLFVPPSPRFERGTTTDALAPGLSRGSSCTRSRRRRSPSGAAHRDRTLLLAAIDEQGNAGEETRLDTCITRPIPDNLNACDPTIAPPFAVLSLAWDADVDLDLVVVAPDGRVIDPKHPTTARISTRPASSSRRARRSRRRCSLPRCRSRRAAPTRSPT